MVILFYSILSPNENVVMRKFTCLLCLVTCLFCSSQDLTTNKGESILPESGDWSIGTSAHPFIHFFSNIFSKASNDKEVHVPSFGDDFYFYMKRMVSADRAIRYTIGATFDAVEETWTMGLGYGVENRRGNTRLQGMWGYNGFIGIGEQFTPGDWLSIPTLIYEDGYNMNVAASVFIGCEYFLLAKIAVGAEYHYGASMNVNDNKTTFYVGGNTKNTIIKINFYF